MIRRCKVCGKPLLRSGSTDGLCREHRFEEGDVWVLESDFNADYWKWKPKFASKTVGNEVEPKKGTKHE